MSHLFWLQLAVVGEGVLIVVLFARLNRLESILRGMLGGWKRRG